jgi:hypothetical protein
MRKNTNIEGSKLLWQDSNLINPDALPAEVMSGIFLS